jgi:hypothetical protein
MEMGEGNVARVVMAIQRVAKGVPVRRQAGNA